MLGRERNKAALMARAMLMFKPERSNMKPTELQLADAQRVRNENGYDSSGRITDPGKFEGKPIFVPYYWDMGLQGFADADNGSVYSFRFKAGDPDYELWPELKRWLGRKRSLKLQEDSQGFVHCF